MAMTDRINRRLLLAVLRAPLITSSTSFRRKTATAWVRKITSPSLRPRNGGPGISFGAENDALIAPYLEKLKGKGEKGAKLKAQGSEGIETTSTDNFEISDFVDRSADRPEDLDIPDEALEYSVPSNASERIARKAQTPPARKTKAAAGKKALGVTASQRAPASSRRQSSMIRKIAGGEEVGAAPSDLPESRSYSARTKPEPWGIQKNALKEKFGDQGWQPRKKLSPDAMEGIRGLHEQDPFKYSTPVLAEQFKVSPEAIRRILKSKWSRNTTPEKAVERRERWAKRHDRIWDQQAELGLRPQRMKEKETEDPDQFEKDMARNEILGGI